MIFPARAEQAARHTPPGGSVKDPYPRSLRPPVPEAKGLGV